MSDVLFRTRTKATDREGDRVRSSFNWLFARRAALLVGRDALVCGDWRLPYAEFQRAALVTAQGEFGSGRILMVSCRGRVYQFQLRSESPWRYVPHPFWEGRLPFPVQRETRAAEPPSPWLAVVGLAALAAGLLLPLLGR
jgi:hypothetical protein